MMRAARTTSVVSSHTTTDRVILLERYVQSNIDWWVQTNIDLQDQFIDKV